MRIGVYLGSWSLLSLGGMGVYLKNLLQAAAQLAAAPPDAPGAPAKPHAPAAPNLPHTPGALELVLLVDRGNAAEVAALEISTRVVFMERPPWTDIPRPDRRAVIRHRRRSFTDLVTPAISWRDPNPELVAPTINWCDRNPEFVAPAISRCTLSPPATAYLSGLDAALAANAIDVLYFPFPPYIKRPRVPFIICIHDLKHIHRPDDHAPADHARRRRWRHIARAAACVYASFEHVRRDIELHLGVPRERTAVIALATPTDLFDADDKRNETQPLPPAVRDLPADFVLMPAQFWVHKNHARVIEAVARLRRERGLAIPIICTGQTLGECAAHARAMAALARRLGVADLVRQLGFVSRAELRRLYERARFVLVASLYEAGSLPAYEAFALNRPLAAARVTSIPETAGDAALLFDPTSVDEIAATLARMWTDAGLRHRLVQRGRRRLQPRTWYDVARDWLALCARAAQPHPPRPPQLMRAD